MPIRVLKMNSAKPQAALSATPLSGSLASHLLLGSSLAEALLWMLRVLVHSELPQIGSPGNRLPIIAQAAQTFNIFATPPLAEPKMIC
jgi:hypothetical protein